MAGTYRYRIEPRDIDATLRVRIYAVADMIFQVANDDADRLGFGVRDLNERNWSWVLSRMAIEMERLPERHEELDFHTWVNEYGRLMTTRNITIADSGGNYIGAAVTQWAMIDLATRRPVDLAALTDDTRNSSLIDLPPPVELPRRLGAFEAQVQRPHRVMYSDIDFNGHATGKKYLEWMTDTMPAEYLERAERVRLDINYHHEAMRDDDLTVCYALLSGAHLFEIRNSDGLPLCRASLNL